MDLVKKYDEVEHCPFCGATWLHKEDTEKESIVCMECGSDFKVLEREEVDEE